MSVELVQHADSRESAPGGCRTIKPALGLFSGPNNRGVVDRWV